MELWKSDGTAGGTTILKDINTTPPDYIVDHHTGGQTYLRITGTAGDDTLTSVLDWGDGTMSSGVVTWRLPAEIPPVLGERHGLLQAFLNLAKNSHRAVRERSVRELSISVSVEQQRVTVRQRRLEALQRSIEKIDALAGEEYARSRLGSLTVSVVATGRLVLDRDKPQLFVIDGKERRAFRTAPTKGAAERSP